MSFTSPIPGPPSDAAMEQLATAASAGLGLGEVLRAVAEESDSRHLARQLRRLATAIDQGQPLESAVTTALPGMPADVRGLLVAAQRTGDLPSTLVQWIDERRAASAFWRDTLITLTYPMLAALAAFGIFLFCSWFVVPTMQRMLSEFGMKLPQNTRAIFWFSDHGATLVCAAVIASLAIAVGIRLIGGAAAWSRTVSSVPVFGDLWHWSGVTEMLRGLRLLLEHRIPLPEALDLTAQSVRDRYVGNTCSQLASRVRDGQSLGVALESSSLPRSIMPLLRAGEQQGSLPESLDLATRLLEARLRSMSQIVATIAPPVIFVLVAVLIGGMYIGLMMPLVSLMQGLS
jgi:type II secretory pathway component PulF